AVRRDEEAGALSEARLSLWLLLRHAFAELLKEVVERIVLGKIGQARDLVVIGNLHVALDIDADDSRGQLLHDIGEAERRAPIGRLDGLRLGSSGGLGGGERHAIAARKP